MNTPPAIPSELARETLKMLVARKLPPTPDNYAKIYAEINGIVLEENSNPEKVLRGIADFLSHNSKLASAGIALKKLIDAGGWGLGTMPQGNRKNSPWTKQRISSVLVPLSTQFIASTGNESQRPYHHS